MTTPYAQLAARCMIKLPEYKPLSGDGKIADDLVIALTLIDRNRYNNINLTGLLQTPEIIYATVYEGNVGQQWAISFFRRMKEYMIQYGLDKKYPAEWEAYIEIVNSLP